MLLMREEREDFLCVFIAICKLQKLFIEFEDEGMEKKLQQSAEKHNNNNKIPNLRKSLSVASK